MIRLAALLNEASRAYYQEDREIMSNKEYDDLYDRLVQLEEETGIVLGQSPTIHVGYEVADYLEKEEHATPMLSLDKTKSVEDLAAWTGDHKALLSWKMDGLTVVLTYQDGVLYKAVTRGNGTVGEVITANARVFCNLPARISFEGQLVLRGEAVIKYSEFEKINASIDDVDAKYKNPRNLCSGTVRQLNSEITAKRNVFFFAFSLVSAQGKELSNSVEENMVWLTELGFDVVPYQAVTGETIADAVADFAGRIRDNDFPSDGLVVVYDDIAYGRSLGTTAKFPRNSIAFKWADEEAETTLNDIEWSPSRTGLINPIAIFEPVELEGTTVSRASLHNISIMESLALGRGDRIKVYKANMIIPQISENLTRSATIKAPEHCPACGGPTEIRMENEAKTLYCTNPMCSAKKVRLFAHYVSRDAMNIDGISQATLTRLIDLGILEELYDLYGLEEHKESILSMEGFREKSYNNLIRSVEASKDTELFRLIYGLGIPNVGRANAKLLCGRFGNDPEAVRDASREDMVETDGIGEVIAASVRDYFDNPHNRNIYARLVSLMRFKKEEAGDEEKQSLAGKTFVITGSVEHFKNRAELKEKIESLGGKVTGSVSKKTDYLINNDSTSTSGKNKKARELGIPVLTENDFLELIK